MNCFYIKGVLLAILLIGTIVFTIVITQINNTTYFMVNGLFTILIIVICYGGAAVVSILVALFIYFILKYRPPYIDTPSQEAIYESVR